MDEIGLDFASMWDMHGEAAHVTETDYARWVLENLATGVMILDADLRLCCMNPAAETLLALSVRQALGMNFKDLAIGADAVVAGMRRCLESGYPYTEREMHLILPGEQAITVECMVTPLFEADTPRELLVELRQVDRQLRINREEHLIAQHHTTRLLVRNLAHEIKNPLGGLRGAAQLLERELPEEPLKEYTQVIIREADRLRSLVDRMLGPIQPPIYRETNIHEILERVCSLASAEAGPGVRIERDYDPSIPLLMGDTDKLIQAFLNIVRNAVEALNGKGLIVLRSRVQRQCTIGSKRYKLVARLDVVDNGPGIPKDIQEEIFYPMISGRPEGSGLGLSIAQSIVNRHGGLIECNSRPGETVFSLLLPLERYNG